MIKCVRPLGANHTFKKNSPGVRCWYSWEKLAYRCCCPRFIGWREREVRPEKGVPPETELGKMRRPSPPPQRASSPALHTANDSPTPPAEEILSAGIYTLFCKQSPKQMGNRWPRCMKGWAFSSNCFVALALLAQGTTSQAGLPVSRCKRQRADSSTQS